MHSQLCKFLHSSAVLSESQYRFWRGHSRSDLLLSVIDEWLLAHDRKLRTAIIFEDLSKAFDNVQHQQLLILPKQYGVGGTVLAWIRNFLCGRSQKIVLPSQSSQPFECNKGVLQGSVLDLCYSMFMFQTSPKLQEIQPMPLYHLSLTISRFTALAKLLKKQVRLFLLL